MRHLLDGDLRIDKEQMPANYDMIINYKSEVIKDSIGKFLQFPRTQSPEAFYEATSPMRAAVSKFKAALANPVKS